MKEKKYSITLIREELIILANILHHFSDYIAFDDRPDHGWNMLKRAREWNQETKEMFYMLTGKLRRRLRK